jgi:hypothetical protein
MTPVQKGHGELVLISGSRLRGEITVFAEAWVEIVFLDSESEAGRSTRWVPSSQCAEVNWEKDLALRPPDTFGQPGGERR